MSRSGSSAVITPAVGMCQNCKTLSLFAIFAVSADLFLVWCPYCRFVEKSR